MSAPSSSSDGPAPTTGQPQAGTSGAAPQAGASQQSQPTFQFKSQAEAEAAWQSMLKDKQDANAEAAETKRKLKAFEDAQKTQAERDAAELAELRGKASSHEQDAQSWRNERAILLASPQVGISPSLALKLIDYAAIKNDKSGDPTEESVKAALAQIFVSYPELKPASTPSGQPTTQPPAPRPNAGATNPSRSATSGQNEWSWDSISKLTPQEYAQLNADGSLDRWAREHPYRGRR